MDSDGGEVAALIRGELGRARGRHANIPHCCIEYYMNTWRFLMPKLMTKLIKKQSKGVYRCCYVTCPKHPKKFKFPKIHLCGSGCAVHLGPFRGTWFRLT